jgi:hypothetical protein
MKIYRTSNLTLSKSTFSVGHPFAVCVVAPDEQCIIIVDDATTRLTHNRPRRLYDVLGQKINDMRGQKMVILGERYNPYEDF